MRNDSEMFCSFINFPQIIRVLNIVRYFVQKKLILIKILEQIETRNVDTLFALIKIFLDSEDTAN